MIGCTILIRNSEGQLCGITEGQTIQPVGLLEFANRDVAIRWADQHLRDVADWQIVELDEL